jgi:hypothetical protein
MMSSPISCQRNNFKGIILQKSPYEKKSNRCPENPHQQTRLESMFVKIYFNVREASACKVPTKGTNSIPPKIKNPKHKKALQISYCLNWLQKGGHEKFNFVSLIIHLTINTYCKIFLSLALQVAALVKNEREKLEVLARLLSLHMARLLAPAYYRPEINKIKKY